MGANGVGLWLHQPGRGARVGATRHTVSLVLGAGPCPDPCCPHGGVLTLGARLPQAPRPPAAAAAPAGLAPLPLLAFLLFLLLAAYFFR